MKAQRYKSTWDVGERLADAFAEGLRQHGIEQSDAGDFLYGWGLPVEPVAKPFVCIDLGYIKRAWSSFVENPGGYYQVGINRLNWVPPGYHTSKRFELLGEHVGPQRSTIGNTCYVIGQVPNDRQHGLTEEQLIQWIDRVILYYRDVAGKNVIFRPHPQARSVMPTVPCLIHSPDISVEEILTGNDLIVTFNSTVGLTALLRGVPMVCAATAWYHPGTVLHREMFFNAAAYAQWTEAEIRSGETWAFLRKYVEPLCLR